MVRILQTQEYIHKVQVMKRKYTVTFTYYDKSLDEATSNATRTQKWAVAIPILCKPQFPR
jgi:hypothetical protein